MFLAIALLFVKRESSNVNRELLFHLSPITSHVSGISYSPLTIHYIPLTHDDLI
ncbi:MAG TPA: hypothetical protein VGQ53_03770 [Chitinophagaceae bacterium]|nr:hypothetical protein [Chitinophagaceae bacterium]